MKKKILTILLIITFVATLLPGIAKAASLIATNFTSENYQIKKDATVVEVIATISANENINALETSLVYDSEVLKLDQVTVAGIEGTESKNNYSVTQQNGKIQILCADGVGSKMINITFKFTVKGDLSTSTEVSLKGMKINLIGSRNVTNIDEVNTTISRETPGGDNGNGNGGDNGNGNGGDNGNGNGGDNGNGNGGDNGNGNGGDNGNGNGGDNGNGNGGDNGNGNGNGDEPKTTDGEKKERATDPSIIVGDNDSKGGTGNGGKASQDGKEESDGKDEPKKLGQYGENDGIFIAMGLVMGIGTLALIQYRRYKNI